MTTQLNAQNDLLNASKLETLSTKYQVVKSSQIVNVLESKGFKLDDLIKIKIRRDKALREGKQKHRMIFSNPDLLASDHSDGKLQLLVTNSYDGTSSVQFQLGFFRFVCSNGLIVGSTFETIRIKHIGIDINEKIDNAIVEIAAQAKKLNSLILRMKNITLSTNDIKSLELESARLRVDKDKQNNVISLDSWTMRTEDKSNDLFTVYNRIQETLIRGTGKITLKVNENEVSTKKLRAIRAIDSQTLVNRQLFNLVEEVLNQAA